MPEQEGLRRLVQECLNRASGDPAAAGDLIAKCLTATSMQDPPLPPKQAADAAGLSLVAFWRAVRDERLPKPVYPAVRAPRWYGSEIRAALQKTRMAPTEALDQRRKTAPARQAEAAARREAAAAKRAAKAAVTIGAGQLPA